MLILTRTQDESITIQDEKGNNYIIKIQILDIKNHQVKIGINAPLSFKIERTDNLNKKLEYNGNNTNQKRISYSKRDRSFNR